jgi:molybdate/tungstate transport system substrate-binding protein
MALHWRTTGNACWHGVAVVAVAAAIASAQSVPIASTPTNDSLAGPLIISAPTSMRNTMDKLSQAFTARHPTIVPEVRLLGSIAGARDVADSTRVPDVFISADDTLIDALLIPTYATWSAGFARSELVLAYTPRSKYAEEINTRNWVDILSRPEVHGARGDPHQDPAAYRTAMFFQLAAHFYLRPKLTGVLEQTMRVTDFGTEDRELETKFTSGAIDYMPIYRTAAVERELDWVELPAPINLGDTAFASSYGAVEYRISPNIPGAPDTVTIRGAPILYGLTVPRAAPHPAAAALFAHFLLSPVARDIMLNAGFHPVEHPIVRGTP